MAKVKDRLGKYTCRGEKNDFSIHLRIPQSLVEKVDGICRNRERLDYIRTAIEEKLQRDELLTTSKSAPEHPNATPKELRTGGLR